MARSAGLLVGLPIKANEDVLRNDTPHVVVGTPGRVKALVKNKALNLSSLKHFVMDECDSLLQELGESALDEASLIYILLALKSIYFVLL